MDNTNNYTTFPWIKKASTCPTWSACVLESSCRLVVGDVCGASSKTLATCCNMLQLYFMAKCNESLKPKAKGEQSKSTCLLHQVPSERLQRLSRKKHWIMIIISTQLYVFWSQFCVWFHLKLFFWLETWVLFGDPFMWLFLFFFNCYTSFSHVCLHLPCFLVRVRYCIRSQMLTVKSLPWTENIFI